MCFLIAKHARVSRYNSGEFVKAVENHYIPEHQGLHTDFFSTQT